MGYELKIDMGNIHVVTLEHINLQDITEMWNRCWRGYYYDMSYSHEHLKVWLDLSQVSLRHSIAILVDNQAVGFTLLSIEGRDGWIAGACVDPDYRRNGLFTILMRTQLNLANRVHLKRIYLEVLEQNYARIVYQSVGFMCVRQLYVYRAFNKVDFENKAIKLHPAVLIPVEQYFKNRNHASFNPAWQRRERYLKRHANLLALINPARTAGALFAGEKRGPLLDIWSATSSGAEEILSTIFQRSGESLSLTNQPKDWISVFLSAHGINPSTKQFEMCIELT